MGSEDLPLRQNTRDRENDKFATDSYDNIVVRVADDTATTETAALRLMEPVFSTFTYNNVCRVQENGAIFYQFFDGLDLVKTLKITIMGVSWCIDTVGNILQEDGFVLLEEDGAALKRE